MYFRIAWQRVVTMVVGKQVEVVDVVEDEKPLLHNAISYWVRLPAAPGNEDGSAISSARTAADVKAAVQRGGGSKGPPVHFQGFVNDVIEATETLKVVFENDPTMTEKDVPYNMKGLKWFRETGTLVENDKYEYLIIIHEILLLTIYYFLVVLFE